MCSCLGEPTRRRLLLMFFSVPLSQNLCTCAKSRASFGENSSLYSRAHPAQYQKHGVVLGDTTVPLLLFNGPSHCHCSSILLLRANVMAQSRQGHHDHNRTLQWAFICCPFENYFWRMYIFARYYARHYDEHDRHSSFLPRACSLHVGEIVK